MSNWITAADYTSMITNNRLQMIVEEDNTLLDTPESIAVAQVRDALFPKYDVDEIFGTSGADRPQQVLRWCINLALYYIYERIPDGLVPERIVDNYKYTLEILQDIEDGRKSVDLPHLTDTDGNPTSKFRWGSETPREHR